MKPESYSVFITHLYSSYCNFFLSSHCMLCSQSSFLDCRWGCIFSQKCRWTFCLWISWGWSPQHWGGLCRTVCSWPRRPGRWASRSWSSSWPGPLSAHGGRHWCQSASWWGSSFPGSLLSACIKTMFISSTNEVSLPEVEAAHYQEVNCLLDHSGLVSDLLLSLRFFFLPWEYGLKIKMVIGKNAAEWIQSYFWW